VTTADPELEPPVVTVNTVLSLLLRLGRWLLAVDLLRAAKWLRYRVTALQEPYRVDSDFPKEPTLNRH
jgi:hypothetical protein